MAPGKPDNTRPPDVPVVIDAAPQTPSLVKSAARVLQILEFFDEVQREARETEIASRLKMPQSSTSVLLKCLGQLGYVDYDRTTRTYMPSLRVTLLGSWLDRGPVKNGSLTRMLEELAEKTGDAVILSARNGIYSQYIHVLQARNSMRFFVPEGSRRLVVWSATGFALLSDTTDEEARALCQRTNAEAEKNQPMIDYRRMLVNIRKTREMGYFFSKGLVTPGAGSIAMPLPQGVDRWNRPLSVAISGLLADFSRREREIVNLMRDAIQRYLVNDGPTRKGS